MKLIEKAVDIELTSEERKVIKDLADNCNTICDSHDCLDCPFKNFCNYNDSPYVALTSLLDVLAEE